jgi:hypothetical protein
MMRIRPMLLGVCATVLATATVAVAADQRGKAVGKHKELRATVEKIDAGVVLLQEPDQLRRRTLSPTQLERMKMTDLKVGDEVALIINENNLIIDARKTGMTGHGHRTLRGTLVDADDSGKTVNVKTPDGLKALTVDATAVGKMTGLKEGAFIKVELDEAGTVIDVDEER